ncbi:MAG: BON domain-containing protein [Acidimicrobiales bacterium]|nr:BON domain-containing protein [Acidimicrobiales bacterium]MBO0885826.1 BON domain-containing protein [Acidimicrobiales bacterium]
MGDDPTPRCGPEIYLAQRLRDLLAHDSRTSELGIEVRVTDGKVLLSGTARTAPHREAVGQVAAEVARGYEILNLVEVPSLVEDPRPEEIS